MGFIEKMRAGKVGLFGSTLPPGVRDIDCELGTIRDRGLVARTRRQTGGIDARERLVRVSSARFPSRDLREPDQSGI